MMKKVSLGLLVSLCAVVLSSGCVVGQKYNYSAVVADIGPTGTKTIGVATHDQRPDVVIGEKTPDVVGTLRGGFGNPWYVTTESGRPLADDMTEAIAATLTKNNFKVFTVTVSHKDKPQDVLEKLKATNGDNLILLTLNEWKSDAYMNATLYYNAIFKVFDRNGNLVAETAKKGQEELGGSMNTAAHTKKAVPAAFKKIIEELFNNTNVVEALKQ